MTQIEMESRRRLHGAFKPTEIGLIPNEWRVQRIGELFSVNAGGDFDPLRSSDTQGEPYVYPVYSNALTDRGLYAYSSYAAHARNSITVTARGLVGVANFRDHDFTAIGRVLVLRPRGDADGRFFTAVINERVDFALEVTGVPQLTAPQISNYLVPVPPSAEQRTIADAMANVEEFLQHLDTAIAKKRDLKQAAMQQLLTGRQRLAGFRGEWTLKRVGDIADCTAGGTPNTSMPKYWGGHIRWMNSGELNLKRVSEVEGRITDDGLRNSSAKIVPARCVLIGLAGQGKTRGTVAMNLVPLCTNQSIAAVLPNPGYVSDYLYYNLDLRYDELRGMSTGDGGRGGLNLTIIRGIAVPFPELAEQRAIAAVLADIDAEIDHLQAHCDKMQSVKQAMMQQLLTGRIRLI